MTTTDTTWLCPNHPFGHQWRTDKLRCDLCGAERTAADAVWSGLASVRGWSEQDAARVRDAHRAENLREIAADIVAYCPDHGDRDTARMDCHCAIAAELRRPADTDH